jgi:hypothetical protein
MKKLFLAVVLTCAGFVVAQKKGWTVTYSTVTLEEGLAEIRYNDSVFNAIPNGGGWADSAVVFEDFNLEEYQRLVIFHINQQRIKLGLNTIVESEKISTTCMEWAKWMVDNDELKHSSNGGGVCRAEVIMSGICYTGRKISYSRFAYNTIKSWMDEPSHRDAIMDATITKAGVGIGMVYQKQYKCVRVT